MHRDSWRDAYDGLLPVGYLRDLRLELLAPRWEQKLSRPAVRERVWVAQAEHGVAGFVQAGPCQGDDSLIGFAGELTMLYVHPRFQHRGIGGELFDAARSELADHPYFWLVVWVVEANAPARLFYDRRGLTPDGTRRIDRFPGQPVPVVRYVGPLNSILGDLPALPYPVRR